MDYRTTNFTYNYQVFEPNKLRSICPLKKKYYANR